MGQLRPDASVAGWLLGISRNVAATHRRSRARARIREAEASPPPTTPPPDDVVLQAEAARTLERFVASLPEEQRWVFVLCEVDGESASAVAEALAISRNTVHSRLRLIREKLNRFVVRERARQETRDV